jgi:hypothetical protein
MLGSPTKEKKTVPLIKSDGSIHHEVGTRFLRLKFQDVEVVNKLRDSQPKIDNAALAAKARSDRLKKEEEMKKSRELLLGQGNRLR